MCISSRYAYDGIHDIYITMLFLFLTKTMFTEDIDTLKRNLKNPYNIRSFHKQLNKSKIKDGIDPHQIESKLLGEKVIEAFDVDEAINNILPGEKIKKKERPALAPLKNKKVEFLGKFDYSSYQSEDTLEKKLEALALDKAKRRIREVIKEIKIKNEDFQVEDYLELINDPEITKEIIDSIKEELDEELASYEGRSMIQDAIILGADLVEGYFNGSQTLFGHAIDLTGFSDTVEVNIRKRKTETKHIHSQIRGVVGSGAYTQIGLDLLISAASTCRKNSRNDTNNTKRAIQLKKKMED